MSLAERCWIILTNKKVLVKKQKKLESIMDEIIFENHEALEELSK